MTETLLAWLSGVDLGREVLIFVASSFLFAANLALGSKKRWGWVLSWIGNGSWGLWGLLYHSPVVLVESLVFQYAAWRGWWKWGKHEPGP